MSEIRWREVGALFHELADLAEGERARRLAELAAGDPSLAAEVGSLLAADSAPARLPEKVEVPAELAENGAVRDALSSGDRVGAWRILDELARGGMGIVYRAERADGTFERRVAIKVVRPELAGAAVGGRFAEERRILAALDHPGIARLLDAGAMPDGRLYLVLDLVAGEPLDRWAANRPLAERLGVFVEVCEAVEHAHRRLVLHRDLKPANILVSAAGEPRLLDFGIARLLGEEGEPGPLTRLGLRPLTPEYASPEQVRGEPLTTASDVYSLGVVLCELLTGRRPYELSTRSATEIERTVCEAPPRRPSELAAGREAKSLRGDLDTVVAKALAKEPGRRYASVAALAEDIRRHLEGRPIAARPESSLYRAGKFVLRHRWETVAVAVALAALVGGLLATSRQARIAREERDRARVEAGKATEVAGFLSSIFQQADPARTRGDRLTAVEVLDRGRARLDRDLAAQPEVQAELLTVIGAVYRDLGRSAAAGEALELALALREKRLGPDHPTTAATLHELALLAWVDGDLELGAARAERALAIRERVLGPDHLDTARSIAALARLALMRGDGAAAKTGFERALEIAERAAPASQEQARWLNNLGLAVRKLGDDAGALPLFERSLAMLEQTEGDSSPLASAPLDNIGQGLRRLGRYAEAVPWFERERDLVARTWGKEHPQYANALNALGDSLASLERHGEALALLREASGVYERALGPVNQQMTWSLINEAESLTALGRPREGVPLVERALAIRREMFGDDHPDVALAWTDLGIARQAAGDLSSAEVDLRRGVEASRVAFGENEPASLAEALAALADCLVRRGKSGEARALYEEAVAIFRRVFPPGHPLTAGAEASLADLASGAPRSGAPRGR